MAVVTESACGQRRIEDGWGGGGEWPVDVYEAGLVGANAVGASTGVELSWRSNIYQPPD